jgi:LysM repeat protein
MTIKETIESYRKRRKQMMPMIAGAAAVLLVVIGIVIVVISLSGGSKISLFATKTPTPTITPSPTNTPSPTATPTITDTPTITPTATASAPYPYVVQQGDTLSSIVQAQGLGDNGLVLIYLLNPSIDPLTGNIFAGQTIILPPPNFPFPTPTPLPTNLPNGSRISYFVMPGDSLLLIARRFNSTVEAIIKANPTLLKDGEASVIYPGWTLLVPINIATPVPTPVPTVTPTATPTP